MDQDSFKIRISEECDRLPDRRPWQIAKQHVTNENQKVLIHQIPNKLIGKSLVVPYTDFSGALFM